MNANAMLTCALASLTVFSCLDATAEKTGETVTPTDALSRGFLVHVRKPDGNMCAVSVKIAKDAANFPKEPEAVLISDDFNLPLHVVAHSDGNRWVSFHMAKSMVERSKLLIGNNDYDGHLHWCTFVLRDFLENDETPEGRNP